MAASDRRPADQCPRTRTAILLASLALPRLRGRAPLRDRGARKVEPDHLALEEEPELRYLGAGPRPQAASSGSSVYARARRHLPATRPLYGTYLLTFGLGGGCWMVALATEGPPRVALGAAGLLVDAAGALSSTAARRRLPLNAFHLAARFRLFVLIVIGESVTRLIGATQGRQPSLGLGVVLGAALVILAALWGIAVRAIGPGAIGRGPGAVVGSAAANLPTSLGLGAASAGLHIAVLAADGAGPIGAPARVALYGGVGLYLLTTALLPAGLPNRRVRWARLATAAGAMGLVLMGAIVIPLYLVPALGALLLVDAGAETLLSRTDHIGPNTSV